MSVLIKGMKMPISCARCEISRGEMCPIIWRSVDRWSDTRSADCPLIELPDTESEIDKWWERSETVNAERSE